MLFVAPFFGEGLSGSSPPLVLLLPWHLAFMVALYGCGALLCREIAHRAGLGVPGLILLGAAFGVWEEAFVDRYWFYPKYWHDSGVNGYSVFGHTNVLLAVHLTVFHAAVSITLSVLVVEWVTPRSRHLRWTGGRGLAVAATTLAATPVIYGEFDRHPPVPVLIAAGGVLVALIAAAFAARLVTPSTRRTPTVEPAASRTERRGIGAVAFALVLAHWVVVYSVATSRVPWPAGVALALLPVAIGIVLVPRQTRADPFGVGAVRAGTGALAFFVLLDLVIAVNGRYDMLVTALVTAYGLRRLNSRRACHAGPTDLHDADVSCSAGSVTELHSERLTLRPVDTDEAERIAARKPGPDDHWADDFPFDGDVVGATMFLRATRAHGEQHPFGHYVIVRIADGRAIGGIGFKGRPLSGTAEIGYGLAPSARGNGFAAEATGAIVDLTRQQGLARIVADTDTDNIASQRTLQRAGFTRTGTNGDLALYELKL